MADNGGKMVKSASGAKTFATKAALSAAGLTAARVAEQGGMVNAGQMASIQAAKTPGLDFRQALSQETSARPSAPLQGRALQRAKAAAARLPANAPGASGGAIAPRAQSGIARQSSGTSLSTAVREGAARSVQIASRPITAPTAAGRAGQVASRGLALAREGVSSARAAANSPQGRAIRQRAAQDTQRVVEGARRLGTAAARRAVEAARGRGRGFGRAGAIDVPSQRVP